MCKYNEELIKSGALLAAEVSTPARRFAHQVRGATQPSPDHPPGPFSATKELVPLLGDPGEVEGRGDACPHAFTFHQGEEVDEFLQFSGLGTSRLRSFPP